MSKRRRESEKIGLHDSVPASVKGLDKPESPTGARAKLSEAGKTNVFLDDAGHNPYVIVHVNQA